MPPSRVEVTAGLVIRLGVRSAHTDFSPDGVVADAGDFTLNTKERDRVENGDGIGAISVWDAHLTTPSEADAFLEPKTRVAFHLNVALINQLPFNLHVFREPLDDPRRGAAGHCALEDVWRADKRLRRQIQGRLAVLAGRGVFVSRN